VNSKILPFLDPSNWTLAVNRILRQREAGRKAHAEALAKKKADSFFLVPPMQLEPGRTPTTTPVPSQAQGCTSTHELQVQLSSLQASIQQLESGCKRLMELFATACEDASQAKTENGKLKAAFYEFMAKHEAQITQARGAITGL